MVRTTFQIDGINGTMVANQNAGRNTAHTLISLDNGGQWSYVTPPEFYLNGSLVLCEPPACSLHFHMDTSEYARLGVYSQVRDILGMSLAL